MKRRTFIKNGCALCMAVAGGTAMISLLDSCTPLPMFSTVSENHKLKIPIDKFGENNFLIVRSTDLNYDIAVIKNDNNEYRSFIMQCTHADNQLRFNGKEFSCSLHGSIFSRTGEVEKGPAEKKLYSLVTQKENDFIVVRLM